MNVPFSIAVFFGLVSIGQFIFAYKTGNNTAAVIAWVFALVSGFSAGFIL